MTTKSAFSLSIPILKADEAERIAYGWASVIEENGRPVVDSQGDVITATELVKAAHAYVADSRAGGAMHIRKGDAIVKVGEIVESVVLRPEVQKAMGIDVGKVGWFVGFKVHDEGIWKRVQSGELSAFSIGGSGVRQEIEIEDTHG